MACYLLGGTLEDKAERRENGSVRQRYGFASDPQGIILGATRPP